MRYTALVLCVVLLCGGCGARKDDPLAVRVEGNRLVDAHGAPLRLLGVSVSGPEYACVGGLGIFAGPTDAPAIAAMTSWGINAVRIPLNEQCWLGINHAPQAYSGQRYRAAITGYVQRLHEAGLYVILDLHWNAPGSAQAAGQEPMADLDHAPAFWSSVARAFRGDRAVLFDLFNEPGSISWACLRDGCLMPEGWQAAGMQALVDAVRAAGARQPVIVTGPAFGGDLSAWLRYRPRDPGHQLVAGAHIYESLACSTIACWQSQLRPVARVVPVVATELGEGDCAHTYVDRFMGWADASGVSYLAWAWNPFGCGAPALVTSWSGAPTAYGQGLRSHLQHLKNRE